MRNQWLVVTFMRSLVKQRVFNTVGWALHSLFVFSSCERIITKSFFNWEHTISSHPTRRLLACATEFVGVDAALLLLLSLVSSSSSSWLSVSTSGGGTTTRARGMLVFTARLISARS